MDFPSSTSSSFLRFLLSTIAMLSLAGFVDCKGDNTVVAPPGTDAMVADATPTDATAPDAPADATAPSGVTAADIASLRMAWPDTQDAGATFINLLVKPDGTATCTKSAADGPPLPGQLATPDAEIPTLLARPGIVTDLLTPCTLDMADAGPTIGTTLANETTTHGRLVFGTCANDNLNDLVKALRRIGAACAAVAVPPSTDAGKLCYNWFYQSYKTCCPVPVAQLCTSPTGDGCTPDCETFPDSQYCVFGWQSYCTCYCSQGSVSCGC